jgi:hypothetical protein
MQRALNAYAKALRFVWIFTCRRISTAAQAGEGSRAFRVLQGQSRTQPQQGQKQNASANMTVVRYIWAKDTWLWSSAFPFGILCSTIITAAHWASLNWDTTTCSTSL